MGALPNRNSGIARLCTVPVKALTVKKLLITDAVCTGHYSLQRVAHVGESTTSRHRLRATGEIRPWCRLHQPWWAL